MIHLGKRAWRPYAAVTAAVLSLAVVLAAPGSAGAANKAGAARAAAVSPSASLIAPGNELRMTSAIRGLTSTGEAVTGRFIPKSFFVNRHGHLIAHGILNMVVQRATPLRTSTTANVPVQTVKSVPTSALTTRALAAAALPAGACSILNLVLGPLHLNLLGLIVDLNRVVLNIIGQTGAGNLLGNLLCAVAGLLDGNPLGQQLGQVAALLNSLLAILQ